MSDIIAVQGRKFGGKGPGVLLCWNEGGLLCDGIAVLWAGLG